MDNPSLVHSEVRELRFEFERLLRETNTELLNHLDAKLDKQADVLQHVGTFIS